MGPVTAIRTCFSKYATFSGRASRAEFWWFCPFAMIGSIVAEHLDKVAGLSFRASMPNGGESNLGYGAVFAVFVLIIAPPAASVTARRLHDRNRSGRWCLLFFGPVTMAFGLFLWMLMPIDASLRARSWLIATLTDGVGGVSELWLWPIAVAEFVAVWFVIWMFQPGTSGPNRYGPDPLAAAAGGPGSAIH